MPLYKFMCPKGHTFEEFKFIKDFVETLPCKCGREATLCFPDRTYAQTFKPFKTDGITGKEVEITSKGQRDKLLKKHNLTMDSNKYRQRKQARSAVEDVDYGQVKAAIDRGALDDGTPIQGTVDESETLD